jgi:putative ABC transport system permease protein
MFKNYLKIAIKVLLRKKFYTLVTLFCISITLSIVIILSSFIEHMEDTLPPKSKFNRVLNLIGLTVYSLNDNGSRNSTSDGQPTYHFINTYVKTMKTPELVSAHSYYEDNIDVIRNGKKSDFRIKYTDAEFWQITDFKFFEGKAFNEEHIKQKSKVVIIDEYTRDFYFSPKEKVVGKTITIKHENYKVIGVVQNVDEMKHFVSSNLYFPITINDRYLTKEHSGHGSTCMAFVLARNKKDFEKIKAEYQQVLRKLEKDIEGEYWYGHFGSYIERGYLSMIKPWIQTENKNIIRSIGLIISTILSIIIILYLLLPASNLANIQLNRIYERHDEIGIRKTFGASRRKLLIQFLIENIIIILLGTIIAILLSWIFIKVFNASGVVQASNIRLNGDVILFSLVIALFFALLSGLAPAIRMSKLQIATILNNEEV